MLRFACVKNDVCWKAKEPLNNCACHGQIGGNESTNRSALFQSTQRVNTSHFFCSFAGLRPPYLYGGMLRKGRSRVLSLFTYAPATARLPSLLILLTSPFASNPGVKHSMNSNRCP